MAILQPIRTKFGTSFVRDILDIGIGTWRRSSVAKIAVAASLFLSVASGYTTWVGLRQYVPVAHGVVAFCAMLGIQGLLLAASWRLGQTFSETRLYPSLKAIYLVTLATSVFFSYSALLDNVYPHRDREEEQLRRVRREAIVILRTLGGNLEMQQVGLADSASHKLEELHSKLASPISSSLAQLRRKLANHNAEYLRLTDLAKREDRYGATPLAQGFSDPGPGPLARRYTNRAQGYYFKNVAPLKEQVEEAEKAFEQAIEEFNNLRQSRINITSRSYAAYVASIGKAADSVGALLDARAEAAKVQDLSSTVNRVDRINQWLRSINEMNTIVPRAKVGEIREGMSSLVAQVPGADADLIGRVSDLGRGEGASAHPFVLATSELRAGNPLAAGALIVAISIDILVLFCGLLMGRPQSYLWLKDSAQLEEVADEALYTVLALRLNRPDKGLLPHIRRILDILKNLEPDIQLAKEGYPAIIRHSVVEQYQLTQEVGLFISMNFAVVNKDGERIALSTRLLLWMAQQVVAADFAGKMMSDINDSLPKE